MSPVDDRSDETRPRSRNVWVVAGELTAIAFEFTGSVVAGVVVGWFADGRLGTEPWLLIAGTLSGTAAGFYRMIQILRLIQRRQRHDGS